jgi:hypothetical protein
VSFRVSGDYDHRERGLVALYRPADLIEFDVHRAECKAGVVGYVPDHFRVPYAVLRGCAEARGVSLGERDDRSWAPPSHPCLYLWSALRIKGHSQCYYPPLVLSAWEELKNMKRIDHESPL